MSARNGTLFRSKNQFLNQQAVAILGQEHPMTLRQLFYRLVSAGTLKNAQAEYKRLGHVMTRLREDGQVPLIWIVDHVRSTLKPSSWSGLADYADAVRGCYRKDFWASLDYHVEVFVEKDAIAGTIEQVTEEHDIRLHVCRGYASLSFVGEIATVWERVRKPIFAYYLGDYDPSGFDIERDLREKLERYSGKTWFRKPVLPQYALDPEGADGTTFCWQRLAVRREDFSAHNLICLPVKGKDKRSPGFVREHGTACAEVDALPPSELRRRVQAAIDSHIDVERWNRLLEVERLEQETLATMLKTWGQGN
jgi:hypothetical protein